MRLYHRVIWLSQLIEEPPISVSSGLSSKAGHILWRRLIHPPSWEPGTGLPVPLIREKGAGSLNLQCGNFHLSLFSADTPTLSLAWHHPETWSVCACCPVGVKVGGTEPPACLEFRDAGWIWRSDCFYWLIRQTTSFQDLPWPGMESRPGSESTKS